MPTRITFLRKLFVLLLFLVVSISAGGCQTIGELPGIATSDLPAPSVTTIHETTPTLPVPTATPFYLVPDEKLSGLSINFYHPWIGELASTVENLVVEFNQTNEWGIQVNAVTAGSSMVLADAVENGATQESKPQVVAAPSEHLLNWLETDSRIRPLNDLIADPVLGMSEQQRTNFPLVFWQQDQVGGLQAGIPAQRDTQVIFYNRTWAAELGFSSPPVTLEAFKDQACAAADVNNHDRFSANDGTGGWIVNTDGLVVYSWLKAFGLQNEFTGNPAEFNFNQSATAEMFNFFRTLVDDGCAWFARSTASNEYFATRQALMYTGSLTDLTLQEKTQGRLESTDEWIVLPFPDGSQPISVTSGISLGVLTGPPEQELAAWLFVRWMSQPENNVRLLKAGGGLPVNDSTAELAKQEVSSTPAWAEAVEWIPSMQSIPTTASWRIARFVLQDAFWYAMQSSTKVEDYPAVLEQLDATIAEVRSAQGQ